MAVRKELLDRELRKLGFRKADGARAASGAESSGGQQDAQSSHPQAEGGSGQHGD